MNKTEFLQRFQLQQLPNLVDPFQFQGNLRPAAVLVPLVEQNNTLEVLLTKRSRHLKHHGGQICFPGGKVDHGDKDHIFTAKREAHEEIGLLPEAVEVVGQLNPYQTISGFIVTPVVGLISPDQHYTANDGEVAEIFQVPLQHFLNSDNHQSMISHVNGSSRKVHFMPYKGYNIWGATAAMLKDLAAHLT
jgi:8-oxo-dGTP pyrophosphatase MutT (NUDIX family)